MNSREIALTTLFLIVLTMLTLYGITIRWPACELPEEAVGGAGNNTNANTAANANTNAPPAPATNVNANVNTNTNANANVNANANANRNANGNTNTGTPTATPPPAQGQTAPGQQNAGVPVIRSVEPASGDIRGNKLVTIKGMGLGPDVVVKFDQLQARVGSSSESSMTVRTPRHEEGTVDVSVERGELRNTLPAGYTYVCPTPTGTNLFLMLIMAGALGGCIHALRSLYWYVGNEEMRVNWLPMYYILPFTGAAMAMLFSLLIVAGIVDNTTGRNMSLFIIALAGLVGMFSQQAALKLTDIANATFTKPGPGKDAVQQESQSVGAKVTGAGAPTPSITPNSGPADRKTAVVIAHTGFTEVKSVTFGGTLATDVKYDSATSTITATAPEHAEGKVEVVVTGQAGSTPIVLSYTYTPPADAGGQRSGTGGAGGTGGGAGSTAGTGGTSAQAMTLTATAMSPTSGSPGDTVTITGTGFDAEAATVGFGDSTAEVTEVTPTSITVKAPERPSGAEVDVAVAQGEQVVTLPTKFKYI